MILETTTQAGARQGRNSGEEFDRDERMTVGQRAFWALVTTLSGVLLYLTVVCVLPRGPIAY